MSFVLHVCSRIVALLMLSVLGAYAGLAFERVELQRYQDFTHDQLLIYLQSGFFGSALVYGILVFCTGLLFLAFIEGIAYLIRWVQQIATKSKEVQSKG